MPFPDLAARLRDVQQRVAEAVRRGGHGQAVRIVAVTKGHGADAVEAAWEQGLSDIGENRIQEALAKMDGVTAPVRWHLIGHLQRNKVKSLSRFSLLHSLDSVRLAERIDEFGRTPRDREEAPQRFDALLQVNVVGEASKGGFSLAEVPEAAERLRALGAVQVRGVMTMAPFGADEGTLRTVFSGARKAGELLRAAGHDASELSMGMSDDFEVAVEEGATLIRLGTVLFGMRST